MYLMLINSLTCSIIHNTPQYDAKRRTCRDVEAIDTQCGEAILSIWGVALEWPSKLHPEMALESTVSPLKEK